MKKFIIALLIAGMSAQSWAACSDQLNAQVNNGSGNVNSFNLRQGAALGGGFLIAKTVVAASMGVAFVVVAIPSIGFVLATDHYVQSKQRSLAAMVISQRYATALAEAQKNGTAVHVNYDNVVDYDVQKVWNVYGKSDVQVYERALDDLKNLHKTVLKRYKIKPEDFPLENLELTVAKLDRNELLCRNGKIGTLHSLKKAVFHELETTGFSPEPVKDEKDVNNSAVITQNAPQTTPQNTMEK